MTAAEKAALEWLDGQENTYAKMKPGSLGYSFLQSIRTLRAMLAEPRLPAEPSTDAIRAIKAAWETDHCTVIGPTSTASIAYRALYAHLTKPKTKTVWQVFHESDRDCGNDNFATPREAYEAAWPLIRVGHKVTIEGREVPA